MKLPAACRGARAFVNVTRPAGSIRSYSSSSSSKRVRIVEVSPRDGLQNESLPLTADTKAELISRLSRHGFRTIEAGSFVTGRVKQMANSRKVLLHPSVLDCLHRPDNTDSDQGRGSSILQFLVPSEKYLGRFLDAADLALATVGHKASAYREALEVSVFVAATEGFSKANLNATRAEAMERTSKVTRAALDKGFRVRGYISCVAGVRARQANADCPGSAGPERVSLYHPRYFSAGRDSLTQRCNPGTSPLRRLAFNTVSIRRLSPSSGCARGDCQRAFWMGRSS